MDLGSDVANRGIRFLRDKAMMIDRDRGLLRTVSPVETDGESHG